MVILKTFPAWMLWASEIKLSKVARKNCPFTILNLQSHKIPISYSIESLALLKQINPSELINKYFVYKMSLKQKKEYKLPMQLFNLNSIKR